MNRRRFALTGTALVLIVAVVGTLAIRQVERNRVIYRDQVAIAVEGRDVDLWPFNPEGSVGVGTGGLVGLVKGRCVGFVRDPRFVAYMKEQRPNEPIPPDDGSGTVIVWPAGTKITGTGTGTGSGLRIRSQGKTVRIGQRIEGGYTFGHDLSGIKGQLPKPCRSMRLIRVGLNE